MPYALDRVSFGYTETDIFTGLSISFPEVGLVSICGRSGSGKTTFLSLLLGILKPRSGEIRGFEKKPAIVFQSPLLLDYLTVEENILFPSWIRGEEKVDVTPILERLHLTDLRDRYPSSLSGGEAMRVSVARALVKNASVLILDEPTGQLDEKNSENIYALLRDLAKDHLLILVTHDEKNAEKISDVLYELRDGNLIKKKEIVKSIKNENGPLNIRNGTLSFKRAKAIQKRYLMPKRFRVLLSSLFLSLILSLIYLGLNLRFNMPKMVDSFLEEYYVKDVCTLSLKENIASDGKLQLARYSAPKEDDLKRLGIAKSYTPLTFFMPESQSLTLNSITANVSFIPFFSQEEKNLSSGQLSEKFGDVIVNENFLEAFNLEDYKSSFLWSNEVLIKSSYFSKSDFFSISEILSIKGVSCEKKTFNRPVIYYSYFEFYDRIKDAELPGISEVQEEDLTIGDLLEDPQYRDEEFQGRGRIFLDSDPQEVQEKLDAYYPDSYQLSSRSIELKTQTSALIDSIARILILFLGLNLISAAMLEFLTSYSLYEENLRYFALIKAFSDEKKNLRMSILGLQHAFLTPISLSLICLSSIAPSLINAVLRGFGLPSFFSVLHPPSFLFVLLFAFLISLFASFLPFKRIKDNEIKRELEGED